MTVSSAADFITRVPDFYDLPDKEQVIYVAYYLTERGNAPFTAREIAQVFTQELKRSEPRISPFLAEESKMRGSRGRFVKARDRGYELSGGVHVKIKRSLEKIPELKRFDESLAVLIAQVTDSRERMLLEEAVRCYQAGSNRALIILTWIVALSHLEEYVLMNHLNDFNTAASRHPDRRVNSLRVQKIDDFTDFKEVVLIELFRSANILSNSMRKMLDARLSERNTAAHPSSVVISAPQAIAFGHDMVANVILKY